MNKFIKNNSINLIIGLTLVILIVGVIILEFRAQRNITFQLNSQSLQILANEKAFQINSYLDFQKSRLSALSSLKAFKDVVKASNDSEIKDAARIMIDELKEEIKGIKILDDRGIIIVAENEPAGTDYSRQPYFDLPEKRIVFERYYNPISKKDLIGVGGPIYESSKNKTIIGTIAFDIDLNELSLIMNKTLDSGDDEVYLIDKSGLLLSTSEYLQNDNQKGILIQQVKSEGAQECIEDLVRYQKGTHIEEHEEEVKTYPNYMGDDVLGAHSYVPELSGCVIAEKLIKSRDSSLTGHIINLFWETEDEN